MALSDTMRAAVLAEPGHFRIEQNSVPEPQAGQVRLRLQGCGVCASNIPPFEGREWFEYPFEPGAPGHEGWGVVEALGDGVDSLSVGDRVAALSYHAYATHDVAEASACVKLPGELDEMPFPGEPLGCAMNVFRRADIQKGHTVAVVGLGFLGTLVGALAADAGARVIGISRRDTSLEFGERFGAWRTLPMEDHHEIIDRVEKLTEGEFCDRVVECVGKQWPLDLAGELTRVRGKLVIAGYHQDGPRQVNMQLWNWRGLDVINAHERDQEQYIRGMREAVEAVAAGRLDPRPLFTHRFALEQADEALRAAIERPEGFMKALVMLDEGGAR